MSSIFAESDHIAHVTTQIPYALVVAGISAVLYLLAPIVKNAFILLAIGIVVQYFILRFLGNTYQSKFSKEDRALLQE
jgi:Na+/H+ antiporter NhaC